MGGDAWRSKISADSGRALHDALRGHGDGDGDAEHGAAPAEDAGSGRESGGDDDEWEDAVDGPSTDWAALEQLERAIDGCEEEDGQKPAAGKGSAQAGERDDTVVVICDDSEGEEDGAAGNEWEEVAVGGRGSGELPAGAQVRKATKQERLRALHLHQAQLRE